MSQSAPQHVKEIQGLFTDDNKFRLIFRTGSNTTCDLVFSKTILTVLQDATAKALSMIEEDEALKKAR